MNRQELAEHLKALRAKMVRTDGKKMTLQDMRHRTGLSVSYLNAIESGNFYKSPSPSVIKKIALGYGITEKIITDALYPSERALQKERDMEAILHQMAGDEKHKLLSKLVKKAQTEHKGPKTKALIIGMYEMLNNKDLLQNDSRLKKKKLRVK